MKNNRKLALSLSLVAIVLAACTAARTPVATPQEAGSGETPTVPAPSPMPAEEKMLYVGPVQVDCTGAAPMKCLQVKETPDGEYQNFFDPIEGFDFEAGFEYELKVSVDEIANPPADASKYKYTLLEVVSKEAVNTPQSPESAGWEGVTWTLDWYLDAQGNQVELLPGSQITAEFTDGQVSGNAGCNRYFGSYTVQGNQLSVGTLGSSMMACPEPGVMEQEQAYLSALGESASFQADGSSLQIMDGDGKVILYYSPQVSLPLTGTLWQMTAYNNGKGGVVSALSGTDVTATFDDKGQVGGSAGCNVYGAEYQVDGNQIQIGAPISTMMFCDQPEGVMDQETAYLNALQSAEKYEIHADELVLKTADDATAVTFKATQPTPLTGTLWKLTAYNNGKGGVVSVVSGSQVTAVFSADGNLTGSAGCNSYNAAYEVSGSEMKISQAVSTLMFCADPEGVMEQEAAYLKSLENTATYQIQGDQLTLNAADGALLATYQAGVPTTLQGTFWQLLAYNNGKEAVVNMLEDTSITAVFAADGSLAGSAGCNGYTATYQVDGDQIKIGPAASTRKFCGEPEGVMEQEAAYLAALEKASTYQIRDDILELRDANGALQVQYQANKLIGTYWQWAETQYSNDTTQAAPPDDRYALIFHPDGVLDVLADCTAMAGKYTLDGVTLHIDLGEVGNVDCGPDSQADEFVRDIQGAASYLIQNDVLHIALQMDVGIMKFTIAQP